MARSLAETEFGRIDEQTYVPDGSSNLPDLIEFAVERHLEAELIAYLGSVWRLNDEQLSAVRATLEDATARLTPAGI